MNDRKMGKIGARSTLIFLSTIFLSNSCSPRRAPTERWSRERGRGWTAKNRVFLIRNCYWSPWRFLFHYMTFFRPLVWREQGKDSVMSALSEPKVYRSPLRKLRNFFERSRDGWKAKCVAAKRKGKALANNVVALTKSRDHWKVLARQRRDEVEQLRQELEQAKNSPQSRSSNHRRHHL